MRRLACLCAAIAIGVPDAFAQSKTYALPAAASEGTSIVNNVPNFMVVMDEGGSVPSEPAATCDNRVDGNSKSTAGFHLEHYFAGAKDTFDQKVGVLRPSSRCMRPVPIPHVSTSGRWCRKSGR